MRGLIGFSEEGRVGEYLEAQRGTGGSSGSWTKMMRTYVRVVAAEVEKG